MGEMTKDLRDAALLWLTIVGMLTACGGDDCPPNKRAIGGRCVSAVEDTEDASMGEPDGMMPIDSMEPVMDSDAMMPMDMMDEDAAMPDMMPVDMMDEDAAMPDPCAAADCVKNSECVSDGTMATCECLEGFIKTDLGCELDECFAVEGAASVCGEHALCDDPMPVDGQPRVADDYTCTCEDNYDDCDGDTGDGAVIGCEVSLLDDADNCGTCGNACAGSLACVDGACEQAADRIVAGFTATCLLSNENNGSYELRCAGGNASGLSSLAGAPDPLKRPAAISFPSRVRDVALGDNHTCVIPEAGGEVACWGSNTTGQLIGGASNDTYVSSTLAASQVVAGARHTCVLTSGVVRCWGNSYSWPSSHQVPGISTAVEIDAASSLTCARLEDATVRCWGTYDRTSSNVPVPADPSDVVLGADGAPLRVKHLSVGGYDYTTTGAAYAVACAITENDSVECWGSKRFGLVNGRAEILTNVDDAINATAMPLTDVVDLSVGGSRACAITSTGQFMCWGAQDFMRPTIDTIKPPKSIPLVPETDTAIGVEVGGLHGCVRTTSGAVRCKGNNLLGQLGRGGVAADFTPQDWAPVLDYP